MWVSLFVLFILIVAMIRIVTVMSSTDDGKQKLSAPFHWLMGLALVFASWTVIGWIFPAIKIDMKIGGEAKEQRKQIQNNNDGTEKDTIRLKIIKRD